jgi:putative SOS response-associated peptidase YedK
MADRRKLSRLRWRIEEEFISDVPSFKAEAETWQDGALKLETFTILTTTANELVRPFHDRMPVILDRADFAAWLVPSGEKERDLQLLRPCPAEAMTAAAANPYVNDARHEGPQCIEPTGGPPSLFDEGTLGSA